MALNLELFEPRNLHAWCIVPFDAAKRGPQARMVMLRQLGFGRLAYDWRDEHIPSFDEEVATALEFGIDINAWFFPWNFDKAARLSLKALDRHGVRAQLWVNGGGDHVHSVEEQRSRVRENVERLRPFVAAAGECGMQVALYNHGGWYGEPENQLEVVYAFEAEGANNVGLVYNWHHAHHQMPRFGELLKLMGPRLLALNLNGMDVDGDKVGRKIIPLGQGELDLDLLRVLAESGWSGPVGLLNHSEEDSRLRLQDNLDGLQWLVRHLRGEVPGPRPVPRSWTAPVFP